MIQFYPHYQQHCNIGDIERVLCVITAADIRFSFLIHIYCLLDILWFTFITRSVLHLSWEHDSSFLCTTTTRKMPFLWGNLAVRGRFELKGQCDDGQCIHLDKVQIWIYGVYKSMLDGHILNIFLIQGLKWNEPTPRRESHILVMSVK